MRYPGSETYREACLPTWPALQLQLVEVAVHDWPRHVLGVDAAKHGDLAPDISAEHTAEGEGSCEGVLNTEGLPAVPGHAVHLHRRVGGHEAPGAPHQHQVVSVGEGAGTKSGSKNATLRHGRLSDYYRTGGVSNTSDTDQACPS